MDFSGGVNVTRGVLWKGIWKIWNDFSKMAGFMVGRGNKAKFRMQKWNGDETMELTFHSIYFIPSDKEASVEDYVRGEGGVSFGELACGGVCTIGREIIFLGFLIGSTRIGREDCLWWEHSL